MAKNIINEIDPAIKLFLDEYIKLQHITKLLQDRELVSSITILLSGKHHYLLYEDHKNIYEFIAKIMGKIYEIMKNDILNQDEYAKIIQKLMILNKASYLRFIVLYVRPDNYIYSFDPYDESIKKAYPIPAVAQEIVNEIKLKEFDWKETLLSHMELAVTNNMEIPKDNHDIFVHRILSILERMKNAPTTSSFRNYLRKYF